MSADKIETSGMEMMRQAGYTAEHYLIDATRTIDKQMGKGTAARHPELVAAYMNAAAIDCGAAIIAQQIREGLDSIADQIGRTESER